MSNFLKNIDPVTEIRVSYSNSNLVYEYIHSSYHGRNFPGWLKSKFGEDAKNFQNILSTRKGTYLTFDFFDLNKALLFKLKYGGE